MSQIIRSSKKKYDIILDGINSLIEEIREEIKLIKNTPSSKEKKNVLDNLNFLLNKLTSKDNKSIENKQQTEGYCYFCQKNLMADFFSYELSEEIKENIGIKNKNVSKFCSKKCILDYYKQYENYISSNEEEEDKRNQSIDRNKLVVKEIEEEIREIDYELDKLKLKEKDLNLSREIDYDLKNERTFWKDFRKKFNFLNSIFYWPYSEKKISSLERKRKEMERKLNKANLILTVDLQEEQKLRYIRTMFNNDDSNDNKKDDSDNNESNTDNKEKNSEEENKNN